MPEYSVRGEEVLGDESCMGDQHCVSVVRTIRLSAQYHTDER